MNTPSLNEAIDLTLAQLQEGKPQMADSASRSEVSRYTDPARFEREYEAIFRRLPNYAGHMGELPEPGSFVSRELAGVPVLIVRDDDGEIRAFVNACRHRGTQLVSDHAGCSKRFVCPYHAWSYNRDGSLANIPADFGFPGLDHAAHGLVQLPLWQRSGLLWVLPCGNAEFDFNAFWAPVADDIEALQLDDAIVYQPRSRDWQANWKLVGEGGLESYHFKKTHAKTIAPYFFGNQSVYDSLGLHSRLLLPRSNFPELSETPREKRVLAGYAHVVYTLMPNVSLLVQEDHTALIISSPKAVDQTTLTIAMLIDRKTFESKPESHWALNSRITNGTLSEDFEIGQSIQKGISSGHLDHLNFGRFEHGLAAFNRAIDSLLGA